MSLESLTIQAGRHFSDRVNRDIFNSDLTQRQAAAAIAWMLISMVRPEVTDEQLFVRDPRDADIKRLCSEILGVGAALEVLRSSRIIDGRTIRKIGEGFDFQAFGRLGSGNIFIEAKGTFNDVSVSDHRKSFSQKLTTADLVGKPERGYSRAIGVIFSTWTRGESRTYDVELLDPEDEPEDHFEAAVREVIRFYARRFDEARGENGPARRLFEMAERRDLLVYDSATLTRQIPGQAEENAAAGPLTISGIGGNRTFIGDFHDAKVFPVPLAIHGGTNYRQAFIGVDSTILDDIEGRHFRHLLEYESKEGLFTAREGNFVGHFQLDAYGVLRGLMTEKPPRMIFEVPTEESPPIISGALRK